MHRNRNGVACFAWVFFIVMTFVFLYPMYMAVILSISSEESIALNGFRFWPSQFSLEAYRILFERNSATLLNSLALTVGVTVALTLIVYFTCFYTLSHEGIRMVMGPLADVLSGGIIPLPFMPAWMSGILRYSPFGAMLNAPLRIYSGDIAGGALAETLLLQIFWLLALGFLGWLLQHRGMRQLCLQGG